MSVRIQYAYLKQQTWLYRRNYKGLHVQILSAEKGVVLDGDPYELPKGLTEGSGWLGR